jgi:hypothetical protein
MTSGFLHLSGPGKALQPESPDAMGLAGLRAMQRMGLDQAKVPQPVAAPGTRPPRILSGQSLRR